MCKVRVAAAGLLALVFVPSAVMCLEDVPAAPPRSADLPWTSPVLLVGDLDDAAAWYRRTFGFEPIGERHDGSSRAVLLSRGMAVISLRPLAVETTGAVGKPVKVRPTLTILVEDVDATVARLQGEGVPILSMPEDGPDGRDRTARVVDPYGNRILLREPLPPGA
jgi:catechol 2,3-dioxygenase-like lactoylglutathione lyase family enzyme